MFLLNGKKKIRSAQKEGAELVLFPQPLSLSCDCQAHSIPHHDYLLESGRGTESQDPPCLNPSSGGTADLYQEDKP